LTKAPLFLHDKAPAHRSHVVQVAILEYGFEEMHHPPYSPDLAPSDYHLFPNLKLQRISTDDELKYATEEWLKEQSELFYFTDVEKLRQRYCTLTKAVITLKNKCMLINLSLLYIG